MLDCRDAVGAVVFEDVPLPFFLKVIEGAEPFWNVFFVTKLNFFLNPTTVSVIAGQLELQSCSF